MPPAPENPQSNETSPLLQSQPEPPPSQPQQDSSTSKWTSRCLALVTPSQRNKGMILILSAEVVGASMDATARFLQQGRGRTGGRGISVFQVIFARMSITWLLSSIYLWYNQIPDFPFGNRKVRGLLFLRALFGFMGLFCLYYSVHYLPLSEATIIRFLVPLTTTIFCCIVLSQAFTRRDLIAGLLSLIGVVIMAHPTSIFGPPHNNNNDNDNTTNPPLNPTNATPVDPVTPTIHLIALSVSLLGVFFAAAAYTMIRLIGSRAHALISVSYFSALATTFTLLTLIFHPTASTHFILPANPQEWILLISLGILGFILQFLLTAGLQMDKSSRATSMLYLQVLFAGGLDWAIWGVGPGRWSLLGGGVVLGSTLWLALGKGDGAGGAGGAGVGMGRKDEVERDEERGLLREGVEEGGVGGEAAGVERRASVSA